jgi:sodium-dependent dicarboxylate transporter 2/3/5
MNDALEYESLFERYKGRIGLLSGPLLALLIWVLPFPGLSPHAHTLAAILAWVGIYWITEPIPLPITSLLGTALCVLMGLGSVKAIFAPYAHPVIFLFIGSFLIAEALAVHGVDRRFASWILSLPWVGAKPSRVLLAIGLITAIISMWISNTAATAMMVPIALGALGTLGGATTANLGRYRIGLLLMLSYSATAGGLATVIGTPPNLIGVGLIQQETGVSISFLTWMLVGFPISILMLGISWLLLNRFFPAVATNLADISPLLPLTQPQTGSWNKGERNACMAFGIAIALWVVPSVLGVLLGNQHPAPRWLESHIPNETAALFAAALLFVLPMNLAEGTFTLSWAQASKIDWGTILLFGGGLAFGELMMKTGLSTAIGEGFVHLFGATSVWGLTAVTIAVAILTSELASNTASATMLIPVVIAIAQSEGVSPIPPAIGACLAASLGFALPISTPPNAIVYGTGLIPLTSMIRIGLIIDVIGGLLIWISLWFLCPLVGLV